MRISDWSSDVCSSDLFAVFHARRGRGAFVAAGRHARAGVQREGLLIRVATLKPLSCEAGEGLKQMASGRDITLQLVQFVLPFLSHRLAEVSDLHHPTPPLAFAHRQVAVARSGVDRYAAFAGVPVADPTPAPALMCAHQRVRAGAP